MILLPLFEDASSLLFSHGLFFATSCPTLTFILILTRHPPSLDSLLFPRIFLQLSPHPQELAELLQLHGSRWWGWTFTLLLPRETACGGHRLVGCGAARTTLSPQQDALHRLHQENQTRVNFPTREEIPPAEPASQGRESPKTHAWTGQPT